MSLIYEPRGKAREYSPLALNIYSGGCDHACNYCYCSNMQKAFGRQWLDKCTPRDLSGLPKEAVKTSDQILLCFVGDPYCKSELKYKATRKALNILAENKCSVAILSKGGSRCLSDLDIFQSWPDGRIKVGATLTFLSPEKSLYHEPGAALPSDRIHTLKLLHNAGVKTWASIEPVIDPSESLKIIEASLPYVDAYKVGKLNHVSNTTDWKQFCISAVTLIRSAGKKIYVKNDLRPFAPKGLLTAQESSQDALTLPKRK